MLCSLCASAQTYSVRLDNLCLTETRSKLFQLLTYLKESIMNWDRIEGNWKQLKGNVKEQWGKLTDDELDVIAGKREHLAGKIQETYGMTKDETEKQISEWQSRMND